MGVTARESKFQFYDSGPLRAAIQSRTDASSSSQIAKRDLGRHYEGMRQTLKSLSFSLDEAIAIVDALNGCRFGVDGMHRLSAEVEDEALAARLRRLSYTECMAVVDAAERFWCGPYRRQEEGPLEPRLREVGLVK